MFSFIMKNNVYIFLDIYNYNCMFKFLIKKILCYEKKFFMFSNILKIDKMMDLFFLGDDKKQYLQGKINLCFVYKLINLKNVVIK